MEEKELSKEEIQAHMQMYLDSFDGADEKPLYFYMQEAANKGIKGATKQLAWAKAQRDKDNR